MSQCNAVKNILSDFFLPIFFLHMLLLLQSGAETFKHCTIEVPVEDENGCNTNNDDDLGTN